MSRVPLVRLCMDDEVSKMSNQRFADCANVNVGRRSATSARKMTKDE